MSARIAYDTLVGIDGTVRLFIETERNPATGDWEPVEIVAPVENWMGDAVGIYDGEGEDGSFVRMFDDELFRVTEIDALGLYARVN